MFTRLFVIVVCAIIVFSSLSVAHAWGPDPGLRICDAQPNTTVTIIHKSTGEKRKQVADEEGFVWFKNIDRGSWLVKGLGWENVILPVGNGETSIGCPKWW